MPPPAISTIGTAPCVAPDMPRMQAAVRELLLAIGEDVSREGIVKTPQRYANAFAYLTSGYCMDIKNIVNGALFECSHEGE